MIPRQLTDEKSKENECNLLSFAVVAVVCAVVPVVVVAAVGLADVHRVPMVVIN